MASEILLTIAIPTYNRADILEETLRNIVSEPCFDRRVEVVISDNCSTDHTRSVGETFQQQYPNIRYYRNDKNIKDANFSKVLTLGKGEYLKLQNDTIRFKPGRLQFMLDRIEKHLKDRKPLCFFATVHKPGKELTVCNSLDAFVKIVSFRTTWIANFGCWREQFAALEDKDRMVHLLLAQVDWTFRLLCDSKEIYVYYNNMYDYASLSKKSGYNFFEVHLGNYLFLFKDYLYSEIKFWTYQREKYRLYKNLIYYWLKVFYIKKDARYAFDKKKSFRIVFKYYWYYPYYYISMLAFGIRKIMFLGKKSQTFVFIKT